MQWAAISIDAEGDQACQAVTKVLLDFGCNGVAFDIAGSDAQRVTGYLPSDDRLETSLRRIKATLGMLTGIGVEGVSEEITVRFVKEEDWANAWKTYFKPIRVGRHLIVTPPWEDSGAGERDRVVVIDPGMAFGTGNHPTTQLCLAALEDFVRSGDCVADIGTGSGILAIAAAKLGASAVFATDIEPLAVQIAARNAAENGVPLEASSDTPVNRQFDVVVSNILANVLIEMADDLAEMTKPGGVLIASGIIDDRENEVRLYLEGAGFTCIETRSTDEWVALILRRSEP